jgi:hypothetical protein
VTRIAAALVAALLVPSLALAQASNNQISYGAITRAPVGSWAEYRISKEGADPVKVRYTLVARDAKQIAVEVDSQTSLGRVVMRMTFAPDPKDATRWNLVAARMRMPDGEMRDMPVPGQGARARGQGASFSKGDRFGERIGREEIAIPAGKRSAEHFRRKDESGTSEVWMDDQVLPVGMVKLRDAAGGTVELVATGAGGRSAF